MLDVALPDRPDAPELVRSFAACLASVTEVRLPDLPEPGPDLPTSVGRWRGWLAGRGAGLVPIARPDRFQWPGYWLAVLEGPTAVLMFGTQSGVVLSPQAPSLLGRAALDLPVQEGYVVAGLDPALGPIGGRPHLRGRVEALALAEAATGPMRVVPEARMVAGRGVEGDRYAAKAGTFRPSDQAGRGYDLTLVAAEVLDELVLPDGQRLSYADARRNVVTRGLDVNALVGRRFRVGDVECRGQRLCEPCAHLERLTTKGVLRGLIHRGGLRADVLTDGHVAAGAVVETLD